MNKYKIRRGIVLGATLALVLGGMVLWLGPPIYDYVTRVPEPAEVQVFEDRFPFVDVLNVRSEAKVIFVIVRFVGTPNPNDTDEDIDNALLNLVKPYERSGHVNIVVKFVQLRNKKYEFYTQFTVTISDVRDGKYGTGRSISISGTVEKEDLRWMD